MTAFIIFYVMCAVFTCGVSVTGSRGRSGLVRVLVVIFETLVWPYSWGVALHLYLFEGE